MKFSGCIFYAKINKKQDEIESQSAMYLTFIIFIARSLLTQST